MQTFRNLLEACLYFVRLNLRRSRRGHGRTQFRVQKGLWRGHSSERAQSGAQSSEGEGGKGGRSEFRVQSSTCLPVEEREEEKGENSEFRVQSGCLGLRRRKRG